MSLPPLTAGQLGENETMIGRLHTSDDVRPSWHCDGIYVQECLFTRNEDENSQDSLPQSLQYKHLE
jgi:hypothetical protein